MANMQCEKIEEQFSAFIEESVDSAMKLKIDEHLQSCDNCASQLADLRKVWAALGDIPELASPVTLHGDIMRSLDAVIATNDARRQGGFIERLKAAFASNPRAVLAGAAALVLLAVAPLASMHTTEASLSILPVAPVGARVAYTANASWLSREAGQVQIMVTTAAGQPGTVKVKVELVHNLPDSVYTPVSNAVITMTPGELRVVRLDGANADDLMHYSVLVSTVTHTGKTTGSKSINISAANTTAAP